MTAARTTRRSRREYLRVAKVLRWLDAEVSPAMIAEYRKTGIEQHGSVEAALALDEKAMAQEGFEQ